MNTLSIWGDALIVSSVGIGIVLAVLLILVFIVNGFSAILTQKIKFPKKTTEKGTSESSEHDAHKGHLSRAESAAIAIAVYMFYKNNHEDENQTITIKKIERRYSPWSSKIYGINNLVR